MNRHRLRKYVNDGLLSCKKHPTKDLWIYNYTAKTTYNGLWDDLTLQCRGLILDRNFEVVARPFKKFFNYEENRHKATEEFKVYEKLDGSLGIVFFYENEWIVATRGSFISDQAVKAKEMLSKYNMELLNILAPNYTWLFEIVYKENTIVVNYPYEELVLLGAVNSKSGAELDVHTLALDESFLLCKTYDGIKDFSTLKSQVGDNEEGFVIKFSNHDRVKIKGEEYCRLHRILTGVSNVSIWEYLSEGKDMTELIDRVPDEWYDWVKGTVTDLQSQYDEILEESSRAFKILETRKDTALYFQTQKYPQVLFGMLDNKDINRIVWKMIKPKWEKPFYRRDDEL